jgi:hypothetical protein
MKKAISLFFVGFLLLGAFLEQLEAGSVRLVNNTPYKLRVVVRGNDGSFMGELVIDPHGTNTWTDGFAGMPGNNTLTPYTVLWYCIEGDPFSTCYPVAPGTTVLALGCDGPKECHPQKQKQPESEIPAPPMPVPGQQGQQPGAPVQAGPQ